MQDLDHHSSEHGKIEQRLITLEENKAVTDETTKDFRRWKNTIIGAMFVIGGLITLAMWVSKEYFKSHKPHLAGTQYAIQIKKAAQVPICEQAEDSQEDCR